VRYDDLSKSVSDFFRKPFPSNNSVEFSTESKSHCGVLKTSTSKTVNKKGKDEFSCSIEPKLENLFSEHVDKVTVEAKFQTNSYLSATLSKSDFFVPGLKASLNGVQELSKEEKIEQTINLGLQYQRDNLFFNLTGGFPLEDRAFPIVGNFVFKPVDNFSFGAKYDLKCAKVDTEDKEKKCKNEIAAEIKIASSMGSTAGHLTATLDKKLGLFLTHNATKENTFGFSLQSEIPVAKIKKEGESDTKEEEANVPPLKLSFEFAAQRKINATSSVQSKLTITPQLGDIEKDTTLKPTGVRLALGATQALNLNTTFTIAADINVSSFLGTQGHPAHSLGFELKVK